MSAWRWAVLADGWTKAPEGALISGGSWRKKIRLYATAVLLEHPDHGPLLFDTGYSVRFLEETRQWPYCLYRWVTPVTLIEPGGIVAILKRRGIEASQVRHIILSHWHADHVGGLKDFPNATLYSSQSSWDAVQSLSGIAAVRKAFLPGLLPKDVASRLQWIKPGGDVLGDNSLQVVALEGHAVGQIGIHFQSECGQSVLLAADACWLSESYRQNRMPHPITRLLNNWHPFRQTLQQLHDWSQQDPSLLIIPCHCPETAARITL